MKDAFSMLSHEMRADRALVYSVSRYNVFREANFVGGLADRLKGAICGFYLALASQRTFFIHWTDPLPLERNLDPLNYDWRHHIGRGRFRQAQYARILDFIDYGEEFDETYYADIEKKFFQDDQIIYLNTNMLRTKFFQKLLIEQFNCHTGREELIREGFRYLFQFKHMPAFAASRKKINALKHQSDKVFGVHLRTGSGNGWHDGELDTWKSYEDVMDRAFLEANKMGCEKPGFYFVSDSIRARKAVAETKWPHSILVELEEASHIDRSQSDEHKHDLAFHEFESLSNTDSIICGKGGFAYIAGVIGNRPVIRYFR